MTKKKFIVCVFLFFFINHVFSQFTCTVKEGKLKSIDISLSLFKNKMYLIVLQYVIDGSIYEYGLSAGNYSYKKDTLLCKDFFHNYTLKFVKNKDELFPIESFPYLTSKLISYGQEYDENYKIISNNLVDYFNPLNKNNNHQYHKLYYRKYEFKELSVELKKGNYYVCKIDELILSEGKFVYNGKYIKFHDKYMNFSFIGIVTQRGICVGYFPFNNSCLQ